MRSGLPEQGLAAALETSGDKAAAALTPVLIPLVKQCSSRLEDHQRVEGTWKGQEKGCGERPRRRNR